MCERPLLSASRSDKKYDFDFVFHGVKDKLRESDLVVGNLETVFAGEEAGYTNDVYSFNTGSFCMFNEKCWYRLCKYGQ